MVRQTLIVKCLRCKGTGQVRNPDFERCIDEVLDHPIPENCRYCDYEGGCNKGEETDCWECQGRGEFHYNLADFTYYIKIKPDPVMIDDQQLLGAIFGLPD